MKTTEKRAAIDREEHALKEQFPELNYLSFWDDSVTIDCEQVTESQLEAILAALRRIKMAEQ